MIKDAGATHVIIGHSERRRLFGETDASVNRKLRAALDAELDADRLHRRDARGARDAARRSPCSTARFARDSTGSPATRSPRSSSPTSRCGRSAPARTRRPPRPTRRIAHIRARLRQWFGGAPADACRILYGGSVKPDNIRELAGLETSTARSWAARASKRARSSKSSGGRRPRASAACGWSDARRPQAEMPRETVRSVRSDFVHCPSGRSYSAGRSCGLRSRPSSFGKLRTTLSWSKVEIFAPSAPVSCFAFAASPLRPPDVTSTASGD